MRWQGLVQDLGRGELLLIWGYGVTLWPCTAPGHPVIRRAGATRLLQPWIVAPIDWGTHTM